MSAQNLSPARWIKAQSTMMTSKGSATTSQAVLHSILVGTYVPGATFSIANGTLTNISNYVSGTFVPNGLAIQPLLDFKEIEFTNGIFVDMTGTINLTVIYNNLI